MSSRYDQKIVVKQQQNPDPRAHKMLFLSNTPFKPKVVQNKLQYQRHDKHRNRNIFG